MESRPSPGPSADLAEQFAAAIAWWRQAGVDCDFTDSPVRWLQEVDPDDTATHAEVLKTAPRRAEQPAPPPLPRMGGERANWPTSFAEFAPWWLAEPSLGPPARRIAPRGVASAALMVLVPMPEAEDHDNLLSGRHGTLIANMQRAMGIAPDAICVAAALPAHLPHPGWDSLRTGGLGDVLLHLLALAAPQRLLVLGMDILPLLGLEKRRGVQQLPLNDRALPLLASHAPDNLLAKGIARAQLWQRWLEWTDTR
ncbi:hypothetical protein [Alteraurantiacibacter palmitatis]|uniref:Uracil-DNA glycosylase-like domain-containing protein n=1 Tax=Alteraurantiacibacter palmitatis TaxID=2054628 RepID=A0ABV7E320_9SPHN